MVGRYYGDSLIGNWKNMDFHGYFDGDIIHDIWEN